MARNAGHITVTVSMNVDQLVENLKEVVGDISELSDLIPDWNRMEADEIEQRLYETLMNMVTTKHGT